MKRLIIDSKKMTPDIMALVKEKYPDGYYQDDIIVFKNHKNETVEAIEVQTDDTVYLIKIGQYLSVGLEHFDMEDVEVDPQIKPNDMEPETDSDEEEEDEDRYRDDLPEEEEEEEEDEEEDDEEEDEAKDGQDEDLAGKKQPKTAKTKALAGAKKKK